MSPTHIQVVALFATTYILVGLFPLGAHSVAFTPPTTGKLFSLKHLFLADTPLNTPPNTPSPELRTQDTHACPPGFIQTGTGVGCRRGAHPLHLQGGGQFQHGEPQPHGVTKKKVHISLKVAVYGVRCYLYEFMCYVFMC
jgi:hypothetical protein